MAEKLSNRKTSFLGPSVQTAGESEGPARGPVWPQHGGSQGSWDTFWISSQESLRLVVLTWVV